MVVVRLMMVSWSECHRPYVCFLITRDLYERRKIGSEIRFINPQNPGVQFLHISTGKSQITCILPCFCVLVRKRIRRSTNALRHIKIPHGKCIYRPLLYHRLNTVNNYLPIWYTGSVTRDGPVGTYQKGPYVHHRLPPLLANPVVVR